MSSHLSATAACQFSYDIPFCSTFINCQVMSESSICFYIFANKCIKAKTLYALIAFQSTFYPPPPLATPTNTHTSAHCLCAILITFHFHTAVIPIPQCHFDFDFNVKCFSSQFSTPSRNNERIKRLLTFFSKDYFQLIMINERETCTILSNTSCFSELNCNKWLHKNNNKA